MADPPIRRTPPAADCFAVGDTPSWRLRERCVGVPHGTRGAHVMADFATMEAMATGATGILHIVNRGVTWWHGLAQAAVELASHDAAPRVPVRNLRLPDDAKRPKNSVLESERGLQITPLPHWSESLPDVVAA